MKHLFLILLATTTLISCSNTVENKQELYDYLLKENNGLYKAYKDDGFDVSLTYYPTDLILANNRQTQNSLEFVRQENDNLYHFILDLSYNGQELSNIKLNNERAYTKIIEDFSFNMRNYTEAVTANLDTATLTNSHFTRAYGITNKNTIMLTFSNKKLKENEYFDIVLHDHDWGFGRQRFRFFNKDIDEAPKINFTSDSK